MMFNLSMLRVLESTIKPTAFTPLSFVGCIVGSSHNKLKLATYSHLSMKIIIYIGITACVFLKILLKVFEKPCFFERITGLTRFSQMCMEIIPCL